MRDPRETLARIRKQADAATEGPWEADGLEGTITSKTDGLVTDPQGPYLVVDGITMWAESDAEFIAAARTDVPRLVDALDAVLDLADRLDAEAATLYNFSGGMSDESEWLEATATRIRTALAGVEGEG
ncbi:hypothetical protein [Micrococcus luteus]|uniref:hypothetical protein n=1 Tax=Micrococcus luteus TaxID=1270 RepID=UPI0010093D84|nr:hypothetical protein [Micrococcus luteus]QAV29763.1 hypothetical protein MT1254_10955 [Micrococcus luteus]